MKKLLPLCATLLLTSFAAAAQETNARAVFEKSCEACHGADSYSMKAPLIGNPDAWQQLIDQKGLKNLAHNIDQGVGEMPAASQFCPDCNTKDLEAVIRYMSTIQP